MVKKQLFCIPYAGGSASFYEKFKKELDNSIELIPIEIKGHGMRMDEECCNSMLELVSDVTEEIMKNKKNVPYALFGYSLGATVCYEVAYELIKRIGEKPKHIFFAAHRPPHVLNNSSCTEDKSSVHTLDDDELLKNVMKFRGLPPEVLKEKELMEMILPILRADFKISNEYRLVNKREKFEFDISVLYSEVEDAKNEIREWADYTKFVCNFYKFEGGHFFINSNLHEIMKIINSAMSELSD